RHATRRDSDARQEGTGELDRRAGVDPRAGSGGALRNGDEADRPVAYLRRSPRFDPGVAPAPYLGRPAAPAGVREVHAGTSRRVGREGALDGHQIAAASTIGNEPADALGGRANECSPYRLQAGDVLGAGGGGVAEPWYARVETWIKPG